MIELLALIVLSVAKLQVIRPQTLVDQFYSSTRDIKYSVGNFGDIPWGRRMVGELDLANPLNACAPLPPRKKDFLLAQRGNCTFVSKARNAQNAGYSLIIIEDDRKENSTYITMADDGTGYTISIPAIFIEADDGKVLYDYMTQNKTSVPEAIQILIKFDVRQSEWVNVTLAISLTDRTTFLFLREFKKYFDTLKTNITWQLQYQLYEQTAYENFTKAVPDCLGNGRYCALHPTGAEKVKVATGRDIVSESLRQICLFQNNTDVWFQYMVHIQFLNRINLIKIVFIHRLTLTVMLRLLEDQILIKRSLINVIANHLLTQLQWIMIKVPISCLIYKLLYHRNSGVKSFPGILINSQSYLGRMNATNVYAEICNAYLEAPTSCDSMIDNFNQTEDSSTSSSLLYTVVIIISILTVFFIIMFYVYSRMVRAEINSTTQLHVNEMVTQYIQFQESKSKKSEAV